MRTGDPRGVFNKISPVSSRCALNAVHLRTNVRFQYMIGGMTASTAVYRFTTFMHSQWKDIRMETEPCANGQQKGRWSRPHRTV